MTPKHIEVELDTYATGQLIGDLMDFMDVPTMGPGTGKNLGEGLTLIYKDTEIHRGGGGPDTITLVLEIVGTAAGIVSAVASLGQWLSKQQTVARVRINRRREIHIEDGDFVRIIEEETEETF